MKVTTLHKYIKYTTTPYSELVARAKKSMRVKELEDGIEFTDSDNKRITLYWHNPKNINEGVAVGFRNF